MERTSVSVMSINNASCDFLVIILIHAKLTLAANPTAYEEIKEEKVIFRSTFGFNDSKCHHLQTVISSKKVKYDKCLTHSLSPHIILM